MDLEAFAEANRRGLLSDEQKNLFAEAQKRGLVPGGEVASAVDFDQDPKMVRKQIAALPKGQRKRAMKQWSDHRVSKERTKNADTTYQYLSDTARNLARGTPVGSWLDEGIAAATTGSVSGPAYDEAVAMQRARNRAVDADSTVLTTLPVIGDVTAGGLTKLAGAVASAPFSPILRAAQGAGFVPQALAYGTTGGLYGALYGAGEGDSAPERGVNAAMGAGAGVGVGVAGAGVASTVGPAWQHMRNRFGRGARPPELQQYHPQAVRRVSDAVQQDNMTPRRLAQAGVPNDQGTVTALGPQGMIADLGQNTSSLTGGIAKRQGTGARIVSDAIRNRRRGARGRIDNMTTRVLGPPVNEATAQSTALAATRGRAQPFYQRFYKGPQVQITPELARTLQSAAETTPAVQRAMNSLQRRGIDVNLKTGQNVNQFLDRVRRQMSSLANRAYRSGDNELGSEYSTIARSINESIDNALSPSDPTRSLYAQARNAAGEGLQYRDGLQAGQRAIKNNVSANQVQADIAGARPAEGLGMREGMRRGLRDTMETATTRFGVAPTAGIRQMIGPQARQKIAAASPAGRTTSGVSTVSPVVTGRANPLPGSSAQTPARIAAPSATPGQLARTVDQEAWFNRLYEKAIQNSQSNANANTQRLLPPQAGEVTASSLRGMSIPGALAEGAAKLFNLVRGGYLDQRNDRVVADMARMLVAQGADRQQIAQGLLRFGNYRGVSTQQREAINRVIETVMQPGQMTASRVASESPE